MNGFEPNGALLAEVFRGAERESFHRGAVAVVRDGKLCYSVGDPDAPVWARSAVKPFQALPLLESGVAERLELTDGELAVMSASHAARWNALASTFISLSDGRSVHGSSACTGAPALY